jgi:hypothetical protein
MSYKRKKPLAERQAELRKNGLTPPPKRRGKYKKPSATRVEEGIA